MDLYPITLEDCLWMYYSWHFTTVIANGVITAFVREDDPDYEK